MRSEDKQERKDTPIYSGVIAYFPDAIAAVARVSKAGNDQHNPGTELHWDRSKSSDEYDACVRHLVDRAAGDELDTDGQRHMAKVAWRALAALQKEIETDKVLDNIGRELWNDAVKKEYIKSGPGSTQADMEKYVSDQGALVENSKTQKIAQSKSELAAAANVGIEASKPLQEHWIPDEATNPLCAPSTVPNVAIDDYIDRLNTDYDAINTEPTV